MGYIIFTAAISLGAEAVAFSFDLSGALEVGVAMIFLCSAVPDHALTDRVVVGIGPSPTRPCVVPDEVSDCTDTVETAQSAPWS